MNIGIVTTWFERGAAYVSKAYMDVLSAEHDVFIYARGGEMQAKGDPAWDLPNVSWAPRLNGPFSGGTNGISRFHFFKWLRKNQIRVIFFNEQQDIGIVREASDLGYTTGAYIDYYTQSTIRDFDVYDFLICNTRRHYSVFKDHRDCLFLQWGTDTDLFHPNAERPLSEDYITFFHSAGMGGLGFRKGTDLLVRAFQQVTGAARLLIHSQVALDQFGSEIASIVESDPRIEFVVKTISAPGLYHLGDVYVYPSRLEGIGLTIPEALASGLPVITTDEVPMNEFVNDQYNGLLIKVSCRRTRNDGYYWPESIADISYLTQKMQAYINNRQLVAQHATNARLSAEEWYCWASNSKNLPDWFGKLAIRPLSPETGVRRFARWCISDLLVVVAACISSAVKFCLPSNKARVFLKRILRLP